MNLLTVQLFLFIPCISATIDKHWWKHTTIYKIHVMSFKDSNGDGIGDLAGITSKLDYFQDLEIPTIRLSSIFSSKEKISKHYGIDNFTDIHLDLGKMDDFDELMDEAKKRNIKVMLDVDFHHCDVTHEWFEKSIEKIKPYDDFFIWKDPIYDQDRQILKPPNIRFTDLTKTSAWNYVEKRGQFYLSTFKNMLPDLNLRNDAVKKELKKIMEYWLVRGVSGFNIENTYYYFKYDKYDYGTDFHEFLREIREYIDIYNMKETGHERILMVGEEGCGGFSSGGFECFGNKDFQLAHLVSSNSLFYLTWAHFFFIEFALNEIDFYAENAKNGAIYEWNVFSTEFKRPKPQFSYITHLVYTISAVLPGVWYILYGSELGIGGQYKRKKNYIEHDFNLKLEILPAMQWDNTKNAGFTDSNHPMYLPMPNYETCNVEKQKYTENSLYNYFKDLLKLREKSTMKYGDFKSYSIVKDVIHAIVRTYRDNETYIILVNFSNSLQKVDLNEALVPIPELPPKLKVVAATPIPFYQKGNKISTSRFYMRPYSAIVFSTEA